MKMRIDKRDFSMIEFLMYVKGLEFNENLILMIY